VPKKGIKVKELARAIGLTSRELIDRCRAEGVFVQNSITKLPVATERRIRGWFADQDPAPTIARHSGGSRNPVPMSSGLRLPPE
jgi:hypothetical protein